MEEKIDFAKVPYQYSMCLNRQCPQAGTCLRQLTEQSVPENIEHWIIISTKVRYAQGFIGILENLPYKQMQTVILHLMNYLGRRTYYRARKGERLLSPSEQQHILNILRNCGITTTQEFDAYVEDYDW